MPEWVISVKSVQMEHVFFMFHITVLLMEGPNEAYFPFSPCTNTISSHHIQCIYGQWAAEVQLHNEIIQVILHQKNIYQPEVILVNRTLQTRNSCFLLAEKKSWQEEGRTKGRRQGNSPSHLSLCSFVFPSIGWHFSLALFLLRICVVLFRCVCPIGVVEISFLDADYGFASITCCIAGKCATCWLSSHTVFR